MAKRRLSPRTRRVLMVAGAIEGVLKIAMLADLRRRPASLVNGSKKVWAWSTLVNSAGLIPIAYFVYGRRGR